MPPLLKTYFNPHHRSFLSTLFTATFLGSVLVVAFPCPVRPKDGLSSLINESAPNNNDDALASRIAEDGSPEFSNAEIQRRGGYVHGKGMRDEIVVMMNERSGRRRFMSED